MNTKTKQLLPSTGKLKKSANPPYDSQTHRATVRYMQKTGYWTAESEAWQNTRSARLAAVIEAWENARA